MGAPPEVRVVVVSYRCRELLRDCLASLRGERDTVALDVVVVDNASGDGTAEMVRGEFPEVSFLDTGANLGFARANNLVLSEAGGRYVLLLNPDTVVRPGALAAAVAALDARPRVGVLGVKLVQPDGSLDHACKRGIPTPGGALAYFLRLHRWRPESGGLAQYTAGALGDDDEGCVGAVNGAFMLVRREAMEQVGLLDERFWMYGEDLDWCYRFWIAGWQVYYWPGATVVHLKGGSSGVRSWRTNRAFHDAMWRFYRKHYAPGRGAAQNAAVWAGVQAKLALSVTLSVARNAARRLPDRGAA
ncbi:MAG: glycosyltransferase family 2 protein [Mycobacteriales bacterium]